MNDEINTIVSKENEMRVIEYVQPKFWHRLMANLTDFIFLILTFFFVFVPTRSIVHSTSYYKNADNNLNKIRNECGLYLFDVSKNENVDVISYIDHYLQVYGSEFEYKETPEGKIGYCSKSIYLFGEYVKVNCNDTIYQQFKNDQKDFFLDKNLNGVSYFLFEDEQIKVNHALSDVSSNRELYYKNIYRPFIDKYCMGFLNTYIPGYHEGMRVMSNCLLFIEFPISYFLGILIVYYIPPLFFKRGRMTFGKAMYHIGLIDNRLLSPSIKKASLRFLILLILEFVLSLFTFGIPFIFSFSMMVFSKNNQGFPDYILGLKEIDASKNNIYLDYVEAELKNDLHKKPIDFKLK